MKPPEKIPKPIAERIEGDCPNVKSLLFVDPVTPIPNSGNSSWEVELRFTPIFYFNTTYLGSETLVGDFTIDWLDGSPTQSFSGINFRNAFKIKHTYNDNYSQGVEITKNVRIHFTIASASNSMLLRCPDLVGQEYIFDGSVNLLNRFDCFDQKVKRLFYSIEANLDGQYYRMKMKLKQRVRSSFLSRSSKFQGILVLQKKRSNKWKKVKPPYTMGLHLQGEVYKIDDANPCTFLVKRLEEREIRSSGKKIKIKYRPDYYTHGICSSLITAPIYLNADYFFTNGAGQSIDDVNHSLFD